MKQIEILNQFFKFKGGRLGTQFCTAVKTDRNLTVTEVTYISVTNTKKLPADWQNTKKQHITTAINTIEPIVQKLGGLGMAYMPAASAVHVLNTVVPDSMGEEMHNALKSIQKAVGDVSGFVCERLQFSREQLAERLAAEQVDAAAMAIYNIEVRNQGFIIGDQTGVGKGRIAASMIRYAIVQGFTPIFITEKPNLFSDFYRDLADIGCAHYKPFIVNARESKSIIKDQTGKTLYEPDDASTQNDIFAAGYVPKTYDFVMATYSQFSDKEFTKKKEFLYKIAENNILVLDEAHNAGGSVGVVKDGKQQGGSNTATFFLDVVKRTKGVVFLSATFAKRPDNMPLYSVKTAIGETSLSADKLVEAITKGGVALQEVLSSNVVKEGQMVRREKSKDQITVNYITLDKEGKAKFGVQDVEKLHRCNLDIITELMRDIVGFQEKYVSPVIKHLEKINAAANLQTEQRKGTDKLGIDNQPFASKTFQIISQLLFSIKSAEVAKRAVWNLQNGKKVVIAFSNTMEAMLNNLDANEGDVINPDYSISLIAGLDSTLRITERDDTGDASYRVLSLDEIGDDGAKQYLYLKQKIRKTTSNISISPIDLMKSVIENAGFSVSEVTGRKYQLNFNKDFTKATVASRKKENIADAYRRFQNNEVDVLFINTSGSTGASAHAIPTTNVKPDHVKQRVMIIAQPELNISTEVQKRGRIDRTGQIYPPIYEYISSAIPAEKRFMMMLQKKLKSLDANTTSNQKQSKNVVDYDDFLNKYGDEAVTEYMREDTELAKKLNYEKVDDSSDKEDSKIEVHQATGRVALLTTAEQEEFYETMLERYKKKVDFKIQAGEYDLEMETEDLRAETLEKRLTIAAKGTGKSIFSQPTYEEICKVNVLKKPFTKKELDERIKTAKKGIDNTQIADKYTAAMRTKGVETAEKINEKWNLVEKNIINEKGFSQAANAHDYTVQRQKEIAESREKDIEREQNKLNAQWNAILPLIKAFVPASVWNFGVWGAFQDMSLPCVCLGVSINEKSKNPFAPSNIEIAFAVSDSTRYFKFNCANEQRQYLQLIRSAYNYGFGDLVEKWETYTAKRTANREKRVIVTGNILQAFDREDYAKGGKLVSFTRKNGDVEKGILLRHDIGEKLQRENTRRVASINVPIEKAKDFIMKIPSGDRVHCSGKFFIERKYNGNFQIITNGSSKQEFLLLITNYRLIDLAENENGFVLARSQYHATFRDYDMPIVIDELAEMGVNVRVEGTAAEILQKQLEKDSTGSNWKKLSWNENNIPTSISVSERSRTTPKKSQKKNDDLTNDEIEAAAELLMLLLQEDEDEMYRSVAGANTELDFETINIYGHKFTGYFKSFFNGAGYNFILENGDYLKGYFRQGRTGQKEYLLTCQFDSKKRFRTYFNNSDRQVKDPYAYFLHF